MRKQLSTILSVIQQRRIFSLLIIFLVIFLTISSSLESNSWKEDKIVQDDVVMYYGYLPAVFIYHDISFSFLDNKTDARLKGTRFWVSKDEKGNRFIKMTVGESVLLSPFFLVAHQIAKFKGELANGFSPTYYFSIVVAAWVYFFLALLLLRSVLSLLKFNDLIVGIVLLSISLATNLFYYASIELGMSHVYSFFLFSLVFYSTIKWHEKPKVWNSFILGASLGLVFLTRIPNIILIILPICYSVYSKSSLYDKWKLIKINFSKVLVVIGSFVAIGFIQLIIWKIGTGNWIVYSYSDEGFFFNDPRIFDVLFSFRKGLFIYSPILLLSILGFVIGWKKNAGILMPILFFSVINLLIISSWWCWWYGGGFGHRAFIESFVLLCVPLAIVYNWIIQKLTEVVLFAIIGVAIAFNFYLTDKYINGVIHYDSMTYSAFMALFNDDHQKRDYWDLMSRPSYGNRILGNDETQPLKVDLFRAKDTILSDAEFPYYGYVEKGTVFYKPKFYTEIHLFSDFLLPDSLDNDDQLHFVMSIKDTLTNTNLFSKSFIYNSDSLMNGNKKILDKTFHVPKIWNDRLLVSIYVWNQTNKPLVVNQFLAEKIIY